MMIGSVTELCFGVGTGGFSVMFMVRGVTEVPLTLVPEIVRE